MKMFHATHRKNLRSIKRTGLDPQKAVGKRKAVWIVTADRVAWAIVHVLSKPRNKGASVDDIVVLEVEISKRRRTRFKRATWYTYDLIEPACIAEVRPASFYGPSCEE